jgi:hypothetical protein
MALVNPNIAMSYRPTVEYQPRNALADYAQVQQIMGGQRQMEVADMQMEDLRRERDALSQIQAAIVSKGGPPDLAAAADEMIRTGRPQFVNQGIAIQESLKKQQYFKDYEERFGAGRSAPAMPSTAPGAITGAASNGLLAQATSPTAPAAQPSAAQPTAAPFVLKNATTSEILKEYGEEALTPEQQAASPYKTLEDFIVPSSRSQTSAGLPSAAAPTNAMLAGQASAPPANVNQLASANAGANINDLMQQYSLAAKAGHPMAPAILKQIEAALKPVAAKPDTVPVSVRELQAYLQMTPEERTAFEKLQKIRTANVTATATAAGSRLESAEQKGKGELNVKQYGEIASAARLAARTLPSIETQEKILDQGFATGFGTEVKKAGASVLAALKVKEAEKFATDAQTFFAATQGAVLQKQLEQKGVQTEADAKRITQTGAQLGNTVNANRFIIDVAKAQLRRDIDQRNFYDDWWSSKKTYEGAEDAWFRGEGGKSLFDRPELKKYLEPTASSPATSSVRSQADAILQRK